MAIVELAYGLWASSSSVSNRILKTRRNQVAGSAISLTGNPAVVHNFVVAVSFRTQWIYYSDDLNAAIASIRVRNSRYSDTSGRMVYRKIPARPFC
jgi:hypothetical protein